jgi:hypothetical protein
VSEHLGKYLAPPQLPEIYRRESELGSPSQGDGLFLRFHEDRTPWCGCWLASKTSLTFSKI